MPATENPGGPGRDGRGGGGRPRRRPPREVEVLRVDRLTPRLVAVTFGGEALRGFPEPVPTAHIKLFLPDADGGLRRPVPGPDGPHWPDGRPTMRTYTPRRYDAATNTLEVWFVLHGEGPASVWAEQAAAGDRVAIGGPGGRFAVDPGAERWWIGGDETALPEHPGVTVTWHERDVPGSGWGQELAAAAESAELSDGAHVWVGCEAGAVRRIRTHLLGERGLPRERVTTRGYWRLGEADHPDHDFGED